ncbi:MAG: STAS domain-containing protein [Alistipes sp.]|jgi:SulP family sulfate permease|nr:STAS domain-containing protein [Alistipes sp.]
MKDSLKNIFRPKLIETLREGYSRQKFTADILSGIIVGIVALPLAIAFGIASGVTPEKGLVTAVMAGFIISLLGGSRTQIGGPTGAFIVIVYGIVQQFGTSGLIVATIMAGVMLVAMGLLRFGAIIRFIPYPVVVGFTSGIALTIFATQINDLLGLGIADVPANFIDKWALYGQHIAAFNPWAFGIGAATIAIIFLMPRVSKKIPGSLVAIVIMTLVVWLLREKLGIAGIETIGDRFALGAMSISAEAPRIDFAMVRTLLPAAFTIAMLGAIESLLSATVADGATGDRHNSNTELIAQGAANIITPFFGGIPATGAIARTMTNINNGGRSPVAGITHAVVLLLIMLFLGGLTRHIPMSCLAGVLVVVAYNMSEWRNFRSLVKGGKATAAVLGATFLLTVIFDLTIAIEIGLLLAAVLFLKRISDTSTVSRFRREVAGAEYVEGSVDTDKLELPDGVEVYEIEGPFFFGIAGKFDDVMASIGDKPKVRIIRMRKVPFVDSTGAHNLGNLVRRSKHEGIVVLLSGVVPDVRETLRKTGIEELVGAENVLSNIDKAMARAKELI